MLLIHFIRIGRNNLLYNYNQSPKYTIYTIQGVYLLQSKYKQITIFRKCLYNKFYRISNKIMDEYQKFTHKVFNNDPVLFKSYVNKNVIVTTEDGTVLSGIVYTVDPVSESIVLIDVKDDKRYDLKVVLGHAVKNIQVESESETIIPELFTVKKVTKNVILQRRESIMKVLLENRFPVTEKDDVIYIKDTLRIEPPYDINNCISTNTIILSRIQQIVKGVIN